MIKSSQYFLFILLFLNLSIPQIDSNLENNFNLFISSFNNYNQNFGLSKTELNIDNIERNNDQIFITLNCSRNNYKSTIATCIYFIGNIFKALGSFGSQSVNIILYVESFQNTKFIANISVETFMKIINKEINMSDFVNNINITKEEEN